MSKVYEVHGLISVFDGIGALVKDAEQEEDSYRMTILGAYRSPNASGDDDVLSVSFTDPPMRQFPVDIEQTTTEPTTGTISFTVFDGNYTIRKLQEEDGVWVSKYKIPLPVEALESIVDTEGNSGYMAYTGKTVQEEELTALSESATDGPVAAVTYINALGMFERRNGSWILLAPEHDTFDGLYGTFIDPEKAEEFLATFDKGGMTVPEADKYQVEEDQDDTLLAAVEAPDTCPPATQDIAINPTNRENPIKTAAYVPLNPGRPNGASDRKGNYTAKTQPRDAQGRFRLVLARLKQDLGDASLDDVAKKVAEVENLDNTGNYAESAKAAKDVIGILERLDTGALDKRSLENVRSGVTALSKAISNLPLPFHDQSQKIRFSDVPPALADLIQDMMKKVEDKIGKKDAKAANEKLASFISGSEVFSQGEISSEMNKLLRLLT
jgi:hypothetical protein